MAHPNIVKYSKGFFFGTGHHIVSKGWIEFPSHGQGAQGSPGAIGSSNLPSVVDHQVIVESHDSPLPLPGTISGITVGLNGHIYIYQYSFIYIYKKKDI